MPQPSNARTIEVEMVVESGLGEPLALLAESFRHGEPVPAEFAERFRRAVDAGEVEVLVARTLERVVGVAVLAYRLSVSAAGTFASIEDLYVRREARRQGAGRALLEKVGERCAARGISYVEVQVGDEKAEAFYAACGFELEPGVRVLSKSLPIRTGQ